ncbi:hypothetical protein PPYR_09943 [Photinus pyralis]|uniref:Uncharacterized protein n=1 Tax=Photinus pyralis TaxID=7054 RepID=A0A5N4AEY1_PHOPY|nr:hypothetical protein PPYR_09943 [Photinus pyralis]
MMTYNGETTPKLCFNTGNCNYKNCVICGEAHNGLLHVEIQTSDLNNYQTVVSNICKTQMLLPTTMVKLKNDHGKTIILKCLLDTAAAQASFITQAGVETLQVKTEQTNLSVT